VWWAVPTGYVVVFALPVIVLTALHWMVPRVARRHWIFGFWAAVAVLGVSLLFTRAHVWALLVLAAGVGAQLAVLYRVHETRMNRFIRRGALALAALIAIVGGTGAVRRSLRANNASAPLAAGATAPNVLLIILDTVRASSMSLYGAVRATTPRLAEWAKRGATFDHAYVTSPWTLPSHASMFTGVYASQQSGDWAERFDATHPTLAEVLGRRGYATGGFVSNISYTGYGTGLGRGFATYDDTRRSLGEVAMSTTYTQSRSVILALETWQRDRWIGGVVRALARFDLHPRAVATMHDWKHASDVIEPFLAWQRSLGARPIFAFLNLMDAHQPQKTPLPYRTMFNGGKTRRDMYDGALRYLDDQVSDLLAELERRGILRNTIVIVTADHGEQFGEHDLNFHGNSLYRQLLHVPLMVIADDSGNAGRRISKQVSLRDLRATVLDLTRDRGAAPLPGHSLAQLWRGENALTSPVIAEVSKAINNPGIPAATGDMAAVVDDSLYIIRNGNGSFEAYAYRIDTTEARNLVTPGDVRVRDRFLAIYRAALQPVQQR